MSKDKIDHKFLVNDSLQQKKQQQKTRKKKKLSDALRKNLMRRKVENGS